MEQINYDQLHEYLVAAAELIKDLKYSLAKEMLINAMLVNDRSPQIHNLLGIIHEYQGNKEMAMRHYRAANVFDGTFNPAIENLIRCGDNSRHSQQKPNFGLQDLSFEERRQKIYNDDHIIL